MADSAQAREENSTPRRLTPLSPGTRVRVQNQATHLWDRTGLVVEARPYRQYAVRLDGNGRISVRNRKHLRPSAAEDRSETEAREKVVTNNPQPTATPSTAPTQQPPLQRHRPRRQTQQHIHSHCVRTVYAFPSFFLFIFHFCCFRIVLPLFCPGIFLVFAHS